MKKCTAMCTCERRIISDLTDLLATEEQKPSVMLSEFRQFSLLLHPWSQKSIKMMMEIGIITRGLLAYTSVLTCMRQCCLTVLLGFTYGVSYLCKFPIEHPFLLRIIVPNNVGINYIALIISLNDLRWRRKKRPLGFNSFEPRLFTANSAAQLGELSTIRVFTRIPSFLMYNISNF